MSDPILAFENWSQLWMSRLLMASWQGAVLIAVVYAVTHLWRSLSPRIVCWLWRLVCLKLLVLLVWTAPVSIPLLPAERVRAVVLEQANTVDLAANSADVRVPTTHALDRAEVRSGEPVTRGISIAALLGAAWIVGALVRASITAVQWRSIERLCRAAQPASSSRLADTYRVACARLAVRRRPQLYLSTQASSPLLARIARPVIVLPADSEQRFDNEELTVMLAHELAHAQRRDLLWNWLATVVSWVFFFHPLVWLLTRRWSAAQEAACDELLIQRHVTRPSAYGQLLVKLATCWPADSQAALVSVGVLGAYRHLERRVLDLACVRAFSWRRTVVAALALSLAAVPSLVPWRLVAREPAERANAAPKPNNASANAAQEVVSVPLTVVESHLSRDTVTALGPISGEFSPLVDSEYTTPTTEPKFSAAHQQAVDELKSLGAYVDTLVTTDGKNNVSIVFTDPWKGREENLALLEKVEHLGLVYLDCQKRSSQGLAVLKKLRTRPALELSEVTDEQLEVLRDWAGIDRLSLVSRHLSDGGLEIVATLPELTRLQVANTAPPNETPQQTITDAGVAALKNCRKLEQLSLMSWPKLAGTTLGELAELDKLEQLQFFQNALSDRGLAAIAKLTQLKQFSFEGAKVTTAGYAALAEMRQLEQLSIITATQFDDTAAAHLANLAQLRALGLYEAKLTDGALAPLASLKNLTQLYLSNGQFTDAGLAHLKDLVHLQIVNLPWGLDISDAGVATFSRMTELASLDLSAKRVTDEALAALVPCRQLQWLGLQGTSVHGAGLAQLSQLPKLETLMLGRSAIEDDNLGQLAMFPALEELHLDDTSISDAGAAALAGLKHLKTLDLRTTKLTDKGLAQLAGMQQLRSLELEGTSVTEAGIKALAEKLPRLQINQSVQWSLSYVMPTAISSPSSTAVTGTIEAAEPEAAEPAAPAAKESAPERAPKAAHDETRAAVKWATEHLRKLGATPLGHGQVGIQGGWKGTDDDLKYIAMIPDLKWLFLDLENVGAASIGNLNLGARVENLILGTATDDRLALITRLPKCQRLTLIQDKLTPVGFRRLAELAQGIEHLTLNGSIDLARPPKPQGIDDEGLRHVAQIQSLKLLLISPSAITDAGLAHLASLDKLESITFAYSPAITGTGFARLEQLATLDQLGLQGVPVNADGLRAISKLSQLDKLMLTSVSLRPEDVAALAGLKNLQSLYIATDLRSTDTDLGDAIVSAAAQMPALRSLLLGGLPLSRASFAAFAGKVPALEELVVEVLGIVDGDLMAIERWKNLRRLSLGGAGQFTDAALERIGQFRQLTQLSLSGSDITDAGLESLRGLAQLESLSLFGTQITGKGLAALANSLRLTTLELEKSAVNDATIDSLAKIPSVEFLDLSDTPLGDKSLDTIAMLKNLRMLTIQRTEITAAGLMQHLKAMPRIQVVVGLKATADEGQQLAKAFPRVQFRLLGGNLFQADGSGIFIADAVETDEPVLETVPEPNTPKANDGAEAAPSTENSKQGSDMLRDIRRASEPLLASMAKDHGYRLANGQRLARIAPPFDPIRMDYYRTSNPTQAESIPSGPAGIVFRWNRARLQQWSMTFGGSSQQGYGLEGLLNALVGFKRQEIEGPKELLEQVIHGDWVVRPDQPAEKTIEQLNAILQRELSLPLRIAIRTVERPVYVAHGDYHFSPVPGGIGRETMIYTDSTVELDVVEIFARELVPNSGSGGGTGSCDEFFNWLGEWIEAPIVSEVSKSPASEISWRLHGRSPFTDQMRREDRDPARVLANITAQTGFTFEKEMRPVKILFVEERN